MTQPLLVGHIVSIMGVLGVFGMGFLFRSPQARTARAMEGTVRAMEEIARNSGKSTTLWSFLKFCDFVSGVCCPCSGGMKLNFT
jgi:hypothetical protein